MESISLNPGKIRGGGNIVSPHSSEDYVLSHSEITSNTEEVNGVNETVYVLDYYSVADSIVLTCDSIMKFGTRYTLSATVKDTHNHGSEGLEVSFYKGSTLLGTSTTNSNGIATYNFTPSQEGTVTLKAECEGINGTNEVTIYVPTVTTIILSTNKNTLSQYDNETAVLTATVLDQYGDPLRNKPVVFYNGSQNLQTEYRTDRSGIVTYTYTSEGAGECNFSAKSSTAWSNSIQIIDYLYTDYGNLDKSNNYTSRLLEHSGTATITHNTDDYTVKNNAQGTKAMMINNLSLTNFTMELDINPSNTTIGVCISTRANYGEVYALNNNRTEIDGWRYINSSFRSPFSAVSLSATSGYNHMKIVKSGSSVSIYVYDMQGNLLASKDTTTDNEFAGAVGVGVGVGVGTGNVKNITIL